MRYKCSCCGCVFEEDEAVYHKEYERHWWLDDSPVEELVYMACPECGCEDFDEDFDDDEESES